MVLKAMLASLTTDFRPKIRTIEKQNNLQKTSTHTQPLLRKLISASEEYSTPTLTNYWNKKHLEADHLGRAIVRSQSKSVRESYW